MPCGLQANAPIFPRFVTKLKKLELCKYSCFRRTQRPHTTYIDGRLECWCWYAYTTHYIYVTKRGERVWRHVDPTLRSIFRWKISGGMKTHGSKRWLVVFMYPSDGSPAAAATPDEWGKLWQTISGNGINLTDHTTFITSCDAQNNP